MDKVKIEIPKAEIKKVKFGDQDIEIKSKISIEDYSEISEEVRKEILQNDMTDKYLMLNLTYIKLVLEACTNIDTKSLSAEELNSTELYSFLEENIDNFYKMKLYLQKEYEKSIMEDCFGIVANKMPNAKEMRESMDIIAETIDNLPEEKLNLISKSIVWNQMPTLGNKIAPATMKEA